MAYDYNFDPTKLRQQAIFGGMGNGNVNPFPVNPFDPTQSENPFQTNGFDPVTVPGVPPPPQAPPEVAPPDPQNDINLEMQRRIELMNKFFPQETKASDRFNELVNNAPKMNKPGIGTRIAAGIGSMGQYNKQTGMFQGGGPEVGYKMMYAPYMRDVTAWKDQITPAQQAATLENNSNNIGRQAGATMVNAEVAADRTRTQEKTAAAKQAGIDANNKAVNEINMRKAQAYAAKQEGASFKVVGNKLYGTYPNGETWEAGEASDYSPTELARLKHEYKMAEIGKTTEGQVQVKQTVPGKAGAGTGGGDGEGGTGRKGALGAKDAEANRQMQMEGLFYTNSKARKWITQTADGKFKLNNPPSDEASWLQSDKADAEDREEYQALLRKLYPEMFSDDGGQTAAPPPGMPVAKPSAKASTGLGPTPQAASQGINLQFDKSGRIRNTPAGPSGIVNTDQQQPGPNMLNIPGFLNPEAGRTNQPNFQTTPKPQEVQVNLGQMPNIPYKPGVSNQPMPIAQQDAEVQAGRRVNVYDKNGRKLGTIENNQANIDIARVQGFIVK